jgi:hypothetical protein
MGMETVGGKTCFNWFSLAVVGVVTSKINSPAVGGVQGARVCATLGNAKPARTLISPLVILVTRAIVLGGFLPRSLLPQSIVNSLEKSPNDSPNLSWKGRFVYPDQQKRSDSPSPSLGEGAGG